jgi:hypothetical protein
VDIRSRRANERGLSVVEGAVAFAIGGSLLAVAIPTFMRELHGSRFVEPVEALGRLGTAAINYARDRPATDAFPPSAPLTPATVPRGSRDVDPPGVWDHPTWQALLFRAVPEGTPHSFAFGFDAVRSPGRSRFVAHAHGDLDGDGITSLFEVRGFALADGPAQLEPGLYIENEVE